MMYTAPDLSVCLNWAQMSWLSKHSHNGSTSVSRFIAWQMVKWPDLLERYALPLLWCYRLYLWHKWVGPPQINTLFSAFIQMAWPVVQSYAFSTLMLPSIIMMLIDWSIIRSYTVSAVVLPPIISTVYNRVEAWSLRTSHFGVLKSNGQPWMQSSGNFSALYSLDNRLSRNRKQAKTPSDPFLAYRRSINFTILKDWNPNKKYLDQLI